LLKYRKARKLKYKEYKKNLFDQLDLLRDSDPKGYWSLLEKLNQLDKPSSSSPSDEIPVEEWFTYFKSLNKNVDSSFLNKLKDTENVKIFTELDTRISNKEIINAIAS
jgi:Mg/Co/Ni transporter MgtE